MAAPITPSKTSTSSAIKDKNIAGIRRVLYDNQLFVEDDAAYEKFPGVRDIATEVVKGARDPNSAMQPESLSAIQDTRKEFATANELTFLVELWKVLLHDSRSVKTMSSMDKAEWIKQAWKQDHLRTNWAADFVRASVPKLAKPSDAVYAKFLDSLPRVKFPKPDLTYGLKADAFTEREQLINDTFGEHSMLSTALYHAFFIVEVRALKALLKTRKINAAALGLRWSIRASNSTPRPLRMTVMLPKPSF